MSRARAIPTANCAMPFELITEPTPKGVRWFLFRFGELESRGRAINHLQARSLASSVRRSIEIDRITRSEFGFAAP